MKSNPRNKSTWNILKSNFIMIDLLIQLIDWLIATHSQTCFILSSSPIWIFVLINWLIDWQIDKSVTFFLPVRVFPWTVSVPLRSPFTSPRYSLTLFVTFTGEVYRLLSPWGWGWSLTGQSGVNVVYVVVIWIPEIKEIPINFMLDQ